MFFFTTFVWDEEEGFKPMVASSISHPKHWGYTVENVGTKMDFFIFFCCTTTGWVPPGNAAVRALGLLGSHSKSEISAKTQISRLPLLCIIQSVPSHSCFNQGEDVEMLRTNTSKQASVASASSCLFAGSLQLVSPTALTWHQNWTADTVLFLFYGGSASSALINQWHQPKSMAGVRHCVGGWLKPEKATQPVTWRQSSKCYARIRLGFLTDNVR